MSLDRCRKSSVHIVAVEVNFRNKFLSDPIYLVTLLP